VVWTVFVARFHFVGREDEIARRPHVARWWASRRGRPCFRAADVWTRLRPLGMLGQVL